MPAYNPFETVDYHFYLGCRKPFFGNTVYRLIFFFCPLTPFFSSITLVLLVFSFSSFFALPEAPCFQLLFFTCTLTISFVFINHGVWSFFIFAFTTPKMEQQSAKKETNVWAFLLERDGMHFSLLPETTRE